MLQAAVARPDLVISLDLLKKELEERLGAGRSEVAGQVQAAQHQIEQVRGRGSQEQQGQAVTQQ